MTISGVSGMDAMMGRIDPATMQQRRDEMFAEADANGDGGLDKTEFAAMHEKMPPPPNGAPEVDVDEMFDSMDTDEDGVVTQAEIEAAHARIESQMRQEMPEGTTPDPSSSGSSALSLLDYLESEEDESDQSLTSVLQGYLDNYQVDQQSLLDMLG